MTPEIKIGDTYFVFDRNRRVYNRDEHGRAIGGPTHRGHFRPVKVLGETKVSWLVGEHFGHIKVKKREPWLVLYTEAMVEESVWVEENRHCLARAVSSCTDVARLKEIAAILRYQPRNADAA
jgi:hypothetical protein